MAVLTAGCGGPSTASTPRGRLLSVADLPAGWSAVPAVPEGVQASAPCLLGLPANPKGYPPVPAAPAAILTGQGDTIDQWWAGRDPAGTQAAKIAAPTLIADGTEDQLVPLANSHILASLIPGARLTLYPDAGHAFLFQDQTAFVPLIESFLS